MIRLIVNGAAGRMGRRIVALASEDADVAVVAAVDRADHPDLGTDAGLLAGVGEMGVPLAAEAALPADVAMDFSAPESTLAMIDWCAANGVGILVGTTGMGDDGEQRIAAAAGRVPCLLASNTSLGVNVLLRAVRDVAAALGDAYDVEIVEAHHNQKKDAPSGTALSLGRSVAEGLGRDLDAVAVHGREGHVGARTRAEIGFHAVRGGDVVGEHTVIFGGIGERVEIRHVASSRDTFVRGAIRAAKFLAGKPAGRYEMADVLGLSAGS